MAEVLDYLVRLRGAPQAAAQADAVVASQDRIAASTRRVGEESGIASTAFSRGFGVMRTVIRTVTGVVGLAGIGFGLGELIKNAEGFQNATAQLGASIRTNVTHPTREMYTSLLEFADRFTSRGGFAPPDEIKAMTQLLRITHSTTRTMQDLTLATNIARGSHKDLAIAARAVAMVEGGRLTMLTRLGIVLPKGTTAQQAYAILLRRYAGATDAYNRTAQGAMTNFEHALDVVGEKIGLVLVPYLTKAFTWLAKFIDQLQSGRGIGRYFQMVIHILGVAFKDLGVGIRAVVNFIVGWIAMLKGGNPYVRALSIGIGVVVAGFVAWRAALMIYTAAQWLANTALAAFPAVIIITAIVAIVAALVLAYEKVGWFRDGVNAAWKWLKGAATDVVTWVINAFNNMVGFFDKLPGRISRAVSGIWNGIKAGLVDALNWVINQINTYIIDPFNSIANIIPGVNNPLGRLGTIGGGGGTPAVTGAARHDPAQSTTRLPHGSGQIPGVTHAARMSSIHIHIDGREIAHVNRRQIMRAMAANA